MKSSRIAFDAGYFYTRSRVLILTEIVSNDILNILFLLTEKESILFRQPERIMTTGAVPGKIFPMCL